MIMRTNRDNRMENVSNSKCRIFVSTCGGIPTTEIPNSEAPDGETPEDKTPITRKTSGKAEISKRT